MDRSIFEKLSIDYPWEDHLYDLTPVEEKRDLKRSLCFKREDFFAPLGYGGINGSKLRQGIFLGNKYANHPEIEYIVGGMSYHSPQLIMQSAIAKHFGKKVICVTSGTSQNALKHEMIRGAQWFGSSLVCNINPPYNGVLQKKCREVRSKLGESRTFYLEYGITLGFEHPFKEIFDFHEVGANQVRNIPEEIKSLVVPFGSANSATSILLGLSMYPKENLKDIYLFGVGPDKREYLTKRLEGMSRFAGVDTCIFEGLEYSSPKKNFKYKIHYIPPKYTYADLVYHNCEDIKFHPTYEGKVFDVMKNSFPELITPETLFWIVGSEPSIEAMEPYYEGEDLSVLKEFKI